MIQTVEVKIDTNPMAGTTITMIGIFLGVILRLTDHGRVNPFIMDIFQLAAWSVAILVGAFTIRSYVKKDNTRREPPDTND